MTAATAFSLRVTPALRVRSQVNQASFRAQQKPRRLVLARSSTEAFPTATPAASRVTLVDELLTLLDGSDCGAALDADQKDRVEALIGQLELVGADQAPLDDATIFDNYNVVYSAASKKCGSEFEGSEMSGLRKTAYLLSVLLPSPTSGRRRCECSSRRFIAFISSFAGRRASPQAGASGAASVCNPSGTLPPAVDSAWRVVHSSSAPAPQAGRFSVRPTSSRTLSSRISW